MTKRKVLSVGFAILGIYLTAQAIRSMADLARQMLEIGMGGYGSRDMAEALVPMLAYIAPLAAMAALLIVFGDRLARAITREDPAIALNLTDGWEEPALRIGFALIGVFLVAGAGAFIIRALMDLMHLRIDTSENATRGRSMRSLADLLAKALFGVYLLLGAPGIRQLVLRRMRRRTVVPGPLNDVREEVILDAEPSPADGEEGAARSD